MMEDVNTQEDSKKIKDDIMAVHMFKDKNERLAWKRKYDKMQEVFVRLEEVEDKILEIIKNEKLPISNEIEEMRIELSRTCVHPKEFLVHKETHIECKFCGNKISIPKQ